MNTALYILRALQLGITIADLETLEVGFLLDLITESNNDTAEYDYKATKEDFRRF